MTESQLNSRDITFRTVFHDVEGIKAYLRKLRFENERVMKNIQTLVRNEVRDAFNSEATLSSMVQGVVNDIISPLKTEWINDEFVDYIGENISDTTINLISDRFMSIVEDNSGELNAYINSAITTAAVEALISPLKTEWVSSYFITFIAENISDTTVNLISDRFMSIVEDNSGELNAYINSAITTDSVEALISPLKTEWVNDGFVDYIGENISDITIDLISNSFMSIVEDNSGELNAYINSAITTAAVEALISPLKTQWIDTNFINYITGFISECNCGDSGGNITEDIQKEIADQFPEIDVKNILKEYHLIEKYYTTLTEQITIDISGLTNPATAKERFRILAYISGDKATDNLHYTYTADAITEDAYTMNGGSLMAATLTIANMSIAEGDLNVNFYTTSNVDYNSYVGGTLWYGFTDLVNPEQSSTDYTVMVSIDCSSNYLPLLNADGERFTVQSSNKLGYIDGAADAIRKQYGSEIEVIEVVPHPLLVNDSERYIVLRAITDSTKKGNWRYRNDKGNNADSYYYNKKYDRSVLKFGPLETPIMYASVKNSGETGNYYYYKLYQTFNNRTDIYSIDLSNFVPWTAELISGLTTTLNTTPYFNNINVSEDNANFGKLDIGEFCSDCSNLSSIDMRCIESLNDINNAGGAFTGCNNLRTVYCNELVSNKIGSALPKLTSRSWSYNPDISAWVAIPTA